jgi:hypothetical protein
MTAPPMTSSSDVNQPTNSPTATSPTPPKRTKHLHTECFCREQTPPPTKTQTHIHTHTHTYTHKVILFACRAGGHSSQRICCEYVYFDRTACYVMASAVRSASALVVGGAGALGKAVVQRLAKASKASGVEWATTSIDLK